MTKHLFRFAIAMALIAPLAGQAQTPSPALSPAPPASTAQARAKRPSTNLQGQVTAVDMVKNTVTLSGRRGGAATTLTLAPDAKVYVTHPAALSDVKLGDTIDAYSTTLTAGAITVTPDRIFITIPPPVPATKPGKNTGFHRAYVQGVVVSTAPVLTMTTAGGVTVTVATANATPVTRLAVASLTSVVVGATIQIRTNGNALSPAVTELRVMPARGVRAGRAGTKAPATAPSAPVAPAQ